MTDEKKIIPAPVTEETIKDMLEQNSVARAARHEKTAAPFATYGTLPDGVAHPAANMAWDFICNYGAENLLILEGHYSKLGKVGNKTAEISGETLRRIRMNEPISDRYLLGLAWTVKMTSEQNRKARRAIGLSLSETKETTH